jgi:dimeric dUTPase (all-alpha-NTP-PPase superfamily)
MPESGHAESRILVSAECPRSVILQGYLSDLSFTLSLSLSLSLSLVHFKHSSRTLREMVGRDVTSNSRSAIIILMSAFN